MQQHVKQIESPYLTKREAAEYLRRSIRSLDRLNLPHIKSARTGGKVLYRRDALDAAMRALETK